MKMFMQKSGFRVGAQIFMVLLVVSMFFVACGKDDPLNALGCPDNTTYCSGSGKCCTNGYYYHCSNGQCYTSSTSCTNAGGTYDTCDG